MVDLENLSNLLSDYLYDQLEMLTGSKKTSKLVKKYLLIRS